jgi:hypothetical protein
VDMQPALVSGVDREPIFGVSSKHSAKMTANPPAQAPSGPASRGHRVTVDVWTEIQSERISEFLAHCPVVAHDTQQARGSLPCRQQTLSPSPTLICFFQECE